MKKRLISAFILIAYSAFLINLLVFKIYLLKIGVKSRSFCNFLQASFLPPLPLHEQHSLRFPLFHAAMLFELSHVQVAPARHPLLALLDGQSRHQP
jgi:hypothetical protein